jgi:hypothetical protein
VLKLKKFLKLLSFTPQFGAHLNNQHPRVYFGPPSLKKMGGPSIRIHRMKEAFGNSLFTPNIIYAGSAWGEEKLKMTLKLKKSNRVKVIFNQNGWYYPAWYQGDWKKKNQQIIECQKQADYILYQSQFCLKTQEELTGWLPENHQILFNSSPPLLEKSGPFSKPTSQICWLSGVFSDHSEYILTPVLNAFEKISKRENPPKLHLAGVISKSLSYKLEKQINYLSRIGILKLIGPYQPSQLPELLKDVSLAIHSKYNDPCPNAIIERMSLGIPHIYSNSGGTPELVGESGLALDLPQQWDKLLPVDEDQLIFAMDTMLEDIEPYRRKSIERYNQYLNWDNYIQSHKDIFKKVLIES